MKMGKLVFKLSASSAGKLMGGQIGLTAVQEQELKELKTRDDNYKSSVEKIADLARLKNERLPELKEEQTRQKALLKSKEWSKEQYEEESAATTKEMDAVKKSIDELTAELKGIAPLTDNMAKRMQDLLVKKLNPELPQGAKTFLKKWVKEKLFKRREEVKSKYLDKGNMTEEDGFTLMCVQLGLGMVYKNEVFKENDFFRGICDLDLGEVFDEILDNKSSYSLATFPMFEDEIDNEDYVYQCLVYQDLYERNNSRLVYTLNDTPIEIIRMETKWALSDDEKQKIALNLVFTKEHWIKVKSELFPLAEEIEFVEIPDNLRCKSFVVERNESVITEMKQRVILAQKFVDQLLLKYGI